MKLLYSEYAPNDICWFVGKVISNTDPLRLGRVQVRVFGVHSDDLTELPTSDLPWANVMKSDGGTSGLGTFIPMQPGAFVFGVFLDGQHKQIPFVLGTTETVQGVSGIQREDPKYENLAMEIKRKIESKSQASDPIISNTPTDGKTLDNINSTLDGGDNAEKIFNFFTSNGFIPEQAVGFLGNFFAESRYNPEALNPNDVGKPAFGLAQWRADRLDGLKEFSSARSLDFKSLPAQLEWTVHELKNKERRAGGKIADARTVFGATLAVCRFYERPSYKIVNGKYTSPSLDLRILKAKEEFERLAVA